MSRLVSVSTVRTGLVLMGFVVLGVSLFASINASGLQHAVGRGAAAFGGVTFIAGMMGEFLLKKARIVLLGMIAINAAIALFGYLVVLDFSPASHGGMVAFAALAGGLAWVVLRVPANPTP